MEHEIKYNDDVSLAIIYRILRLKTKINVHPSLLNNNVKNNIVNIITNENQNKCNKYGLVKNIIDIQIDNITAAPSEVDHIFCSISPDIEYFANICIPNIGDYIIVQILKFNNNLFLAYFDCIKLIIEITETNINEKNFYFDENKNLYCTKLKKQLEINDYIIVNITAVKFHINDTEIRTLAKLYDICDDEDIINTFNETCKLEKTNNLQFSYDNIK